jgi:hypothetical protein
MFPWMTTVAALMLAGLTLATAGGALMLFATKRAGAFEEESRPR